MGKKKFNLGTVEVNNKDRYVYKFVKCCCSENYTYDYLTKDLRINNGFNNILCQIYAVIRLIVPEGAIIVTPTTQSCNDYYNHVYNRCTKHRTDKLIFDRVISYFYIDNSLIRNPNDRYIRLYSKDINKLLKEYNINKNQIKYYSMHSSPVNYRPNIIIKPFEKLDCDTSIECSFGLHFFFNMKDLNTYVHLMMCR